MSAHPSEDEMKRLAREDPGALIRLMSAFDAPPLVRAALEALGHHADTTPAVVDTIIDFARRTTASYVREAAVYGLTLHDTPEARAYLAEAQHDPQWESARVAAARVLRFLEAE